MIIWQDTIRRSGHDPVCLEFYHHPEGFPDPRLITDANYSVHFSGPGINLLALIYECSLAARHFGIPEGGEDPVHELYSIGVWTEEVLASLMRQGWYWGCKNTPGSVFNRDLLLGIHPPGTPDLFLETIECPEN